MSSLRPVRGTPAEVLDLLRDWDGEDAEPDPLVVETSGSTAEPKRVLLSRAAMRASADATAARLGGHGQWLLNLPPTYVAGLQVLFRSVRAGTEPVVDPGALVTATASMSAERRYVSLVPTQLHRLLGERAAVSALRTFSAVLVGGAAVPPELRRRAADAGVHVVATYGMSETCGGCVYDGVPLDGVAVVVGSDDSGNRPAGSAGPSAGLSAGPSVGRVRLAGPVLFDGYDGRPDVTAEVLRDGWFLTQDLGRLDEDGRLQVLGRVDDVVISGGVNVPGPVVAARLREHPAVEAAEVVAVPDDEWGQRVVACVVGSVSLDEARDWVAEEHPRSWAPRQLVRLDVVPLLENGKVDRRRLQELADA